MTPDRSKGTDDERRIVPFRPRTGSSRGWAWPQRAARPPASAAEGFAKYEGGGRDDNYRQRMMVNFLALVFTVALAGAGVWLAVQIAELRKNEDCVLSGRRNCNPIDVNAFKR